MEMRAILANVLRRWSFTCSEPYKNPTTKLEMSIGTMGPRDVTPEGLEESARLSAIGKTPAGGLYLHLHRRRTEGGVEAEPDPIAASRVRVAGSRL